ncbi:MAG: class I SAM-dependent DNA methyltransferase [Hyphomicrobiaceae bacterium]
MTGDKRFLDKAYKLSDDATPDEVRAFYDNWADVYDAELVDEQQYVMPARAADALAAHLDDKAACILDIGCGTGLSGKALCHHGFKNIDGCDLSPGMLAKAKGLDIYGRLFEADLTKPPLDAGNEAYDAVTVVGAFSFGHVPVSAMDDILRIVKDQGLFLITTNDHYYDEGTIQPKLDQLVQDNIVSMRVAEHGGHIEGLNVGGWIFLMQKEPQTGSR